MARLHPSRVWRACEPALQSNGSSVLVRAWLLSGLCLLSGCTGIDNDPGQGRWDPNAACAGHGGVTSVEHTMAGSFMPISAVCKDGLHITNPEYAK